MHHLFVRERLSTAEVAERLNEAGLRPRIAAAWQYQTVRQTVTNPTLWTGETEWGAPSRSHRPHAHVTKMNRDGHRNGARRCGSCSEIQCSRGRSGRRCSAR